MVISALVRGGKGLINNADGKRQYEYPTLVNLQELWLEMDEKGNVGAQALSWV